ncbi:MAG: hypothetical protein C0476_00425 [Sphingomonas sp.]|nr:hypothetical protein [Sphingomonas sp.]
MALIGQEERTVAATSRTHMRKGSFRDRHARQLMATLGWIVLKKAPLQNVAKQSNFEYFDRA